MLSNYVEVALLAGHPHKRMEHGDEHLEAERVLFDAVGDVTVATHAEDSNHAEAMLKNSVIVGLRAPLCLMRPWP